MRFGVSAFDQRCAAEERRQTRRMIRDEDRGLTALAPVAVAILNQNDGSTGNSQSLFILGLHNPFDTNTLRQLPKP